MTIADLAACGEALYGPRWQTELALLLRIDSRRVRAWLQGERTVPDGIRRELVAALRDKSSECAALAQKMSN
jgi:hypothetical protein